MNSTWKAVVRLSRPSNVLIGMLSVFIAAAITGTVSPVRKVLLASLSAGLITAAANTINDFFDVEIDRVNKPGRPLPAGWMSPLQARNLALTEFVLGWLLAAGINSWAVRIAISVSVLLYFYSARLKRTPLWGNLAVSLASALAFVYGGVAVNRVRQTLVPAAFAFFYHLGREVIKDIQDMEGDARQGARTFPLRFGQKAALQLVTGIYLLLSVLILLPFWAKWYGLRYLMVCVVGIYPVLAYVLVRIWRDRSFTSLELVSNLLKADMLVGLLAVYLG